MMTEAGVLGRAQMPRAYEPKRPAPPPPPPAPAANPYGISTFDVGKWNAGERAQQNYTQQQQQAQAAQQQQVWEQQRAQNAQKFDMSNPGAAELAYQQHGADTFAPGQVQQWNQQYGQQYMQADPNQQLWEQTRQQGGAPSNYAAQEYQQFAGNRPNIASEPGFGSYYDRAQQEVTRGLNDQLASRGAYGSSVGVGQIGEAISGLRADQARNEANYNLQRLGEQRGWGELGGQLARNADLTGQGGLQTLGSLAQGASGSRFQGLQGAQGSAQAADAEQRARLGLGYSAAATAQQGQEGRIGQMYDWGQQNAMNQAGIVGNAFQGLLGGDQPLYGAEHAVQMGGPREAINYGSQNNLLNQWGQFSGGAKDFGEGYKAMFG